MNRNIIAKHPVKSQEIQVHPFDTPADNTNQGMQKSDNYFGRLVKYVPTEVIAVYMVLSNIVQMDTSPFRSTYLWGIMIFGFVGTFIWLKHNQKVNSKTQILLSCIAFLAWSISISAPPFYIQPTLKALIAPTITFLIAAFKPESN
jgi:FtsH-binding integral membrane protein